MNCTANNLYLSHKCDIFKITQRKKDKKIQMCNNLAKIRKDKGLTQKELALEVGSSQQFISDIENRKVIPSLKMAFKIKNILGVALEEIFYVC